MSVPRTVQPISLAEKAYQAIRDLIVSLELAPGAVIDEPELMERLGIGRAAALHAFADMITAGIPVAFGSDSPVTSINGWAGVRAAMFHHEEHQRVSARAAFRAHSRGGWRLARLDGRGAGELTIGAPATLAIWAAGELVVQSPDGRISAWSTDPRSGTPQLPLIAPDRPDPVCRRTLRDGVVLYDAW